MSKKNEENLKYYFGISLKIRTETALFIHLLRPEQRYQRLLVVILCETFIVHCISLSISFTFSSPDISRGKRVSRRVARRRDSCSLFPLNAIPPEMSL